MKKNVLLTFSFLSVAVIAILFQLSCNCSNCTNAPMNQAQMVARGKYLVAAVGCSDCHAPKIMTATGPVPDTTKFLAGHLEGSPLPPLDSNSLHPGYWILGTPDLTAWAGPWGMSFAANLTPDSTTGIGAWTEDNFVKAIRTGKHLGMSGGRTILPPMPVNDIAQLTDEDLKSVYAYLRTIPAIKNRVHAPVTPPELITLVNNDGK